MSHQIIIPLFESIYESTSSNQQTFDSFNSFISYLRHKSERVIESKQDNHLFSPSVFDPDKSPHWKRGLVNVVYSSFICFDLDNTEIEPYVLGIILDNLQFLCFNSYSNAPNDLRYRVTIPMDRLVNATEYDEIARHLARVIDFESGTRRTGLDMRKLHAASLFYLPSRAAHAQGSFFDIYDGNDRKPIHVDGLLETARRKAPVHRVQQADLSNIDGLDHDRVERARHNWRTASVGEGNDAFFHFGCELARCGMSLHAIEMELRAEAANATKGSEKDRDAQVDGIMAYIKRVMAPAY